MNQFTGTAYNAPAAPNTSYTFTYYDTYRGATLFVGQLNSTRSQCGFGTTIVI
jgi:hypothetical protein